MHAIPASLYGNNLGCRHSRFICIADFSVLRKAVILAAVVLFPFVSVGENLVRDDFLPDNVGGVLGWTGGSDSNAAMDLELLSKESSGGIPAVRVLCRSLVQNYGDCKFCVLPRLPLVKGAKYKLSAQVRTHGMEKVGPLRFVLSEKPWKAGPGIIDIPRDTHGEWKDISWEGTLDIPSEDGMYECVLYICSKAKGFPDPSTVWVDFRAPCLEGPVGKGYDREKSLNAQPYPIRITPVDPLLSEIDATNASMVFYCTSASAKFMRGDRKFLRATVAGGRTVTAEFDADGSAKAVFGKVKPGRTNLRAELVGADTGRIYATNDYRAFVREAVPGVTPLKRLNNYVSEMFNRPYSAGDIEFTLAKNTWIYVALSGVGANGEVSAAVDGEAVKFFPVAGKMEFMRELGAGKHVLSLKGGSGGELVVRTIKRIYRAALHKAYRMAPNFTNYCYGEDFFREMGLFSSLNATSINTSQMSDPNAKHMEDIMRERGVQVAYSYGLQYRDQRRYDLGEYLAYVTNQPSYVAGLRGQFDENAIGIGQGRVSKINSAVVWWRAYADERLIDVFFCDGAIALHEYPYLDIPELSAYVNNGDGRSTLLSEAYYRSPETQADFDATVNFAKQQFRRMGELVPSAPARYFYLFNGWMMIGGWTSWYSTGTDIRAFNAEMLRVFATDPAFSEMGGAAFSTPACYEDYLRFIVAAIRYYCIEGGTGSFAEMNGMEMWPRHIENGDFLNGFDGWNVHAAQEGSLVTDHMEKFGRWQGRQYPRVYKVEKTPGDYFAVFEQSAKGPNVLRRKITGLTPGRVYQLTCAVSDLDTARKGKEAGNFRKVKYVNLPFMRVDIEGAEVIEDLRHVFDDIGKYGKKCVFPTRVVFRAKTSEAEVVFSDWNADGTPGVKPGQKTILNYIGVYPYFYEGEDQLEALKRFTRQAKEMLK